MSCKIGLRRIGITSEELKIAIDNAKKWYEPLLPEDDKKIKLLKQFDNFTKELKNRAEAFDLLNKQEGSKSIFGFIKRIEDKVLGKQTEKNVGFTKFVRKLWAKLAGEKEDDDVSPEQREALSVIMAEFIYLALLQDQKVTLGESAKIQKLEKVLGFKENSPGLNILKDNILYQYERVLKEKKDEDKKQMDDQTIEFHKEWARILIKGLEDDKKNIKTLFTKNMASMVPGYISECINQATESVQIAMYCLNEESILKAIDNKLDENVMVQMVLDKSQHEKDPSVVKKLKAMEQKKHLELRFGKGVMHHKFAILKSKDSRMVLTGSLNWTEGGKDNEENLMKISHTYVIENFEKGFSALWNDVETTIDVIEQKCIKNIIKNIIKDDPSLAGKEEQVKQKVNIDWRDNDKLLCGVKSLSKSDFNKYAAKVKEAIT